MVLLVGKLPPEVRGAIATRRSMALTRTVARLRVPPLRITVPPRVLVPIEGLRVRLVPLLVAMGPTALVIVPLLARPTAMVIGSMVPIVHGSSVCGKCEHHPL